MLDTPIIEKRTVCLLSTRYRYPILTYTYVPHRHVCPYARTHACIHTAVLDYRKYPLYLYIFFHNFVKRARDDQRIEVMARLIELSYLDLRRKGEIHVLT